MGVFGVGTQLNSLDGDSSFPNHLCGPARGQDADIALSQTFSQVKQTGLVVDGEDSCDLVSAAQVKWPRWEELEDNPYQIFAPWFR